MSSSEFTEQLGGELPANLEVRANQFSKREEQILRYYQELNTIFAIIMALNGGGAVGDAYRVLLRGDDSKTERQRDVEVRSYIARMQTEAFFIQNTIYHLKGQPDFQTLVFKVLGEHMTDSGDILSLDLRRRLKLAQDIMEPFYVMFRNFRRKLRDESRARNELMTPDEDLDREAATYVMGLGVSIMESTAETLEIKQNIRKDHDNRRRQWDMVINKLSLILGSTQSLEVKESNPLTAYLRDKSAFRARNLLLNWEGLYEMMNPNRSVSDAVRFAEVGSIPRLTIASPTAAENYLKQVRNILDDGLSLAREVKQFLALGAHLETDGSRQNLTAVNQLQTPIAGVNVTRATPLSPPDVRRVRTAEEIDQENKKEYFQRILNKALQGNQLGADDIRFLYGLNSLGHMYEKSWLHYMPKPFMRGVLDFISKRNFRIDISIAFGCRPEEVALKKEEINRNTRLYAGSFFPGIFSDYPRLRIAPCAPRYEVGLYEITIVPQDIPMYSEAMLQHTDRLRFSPDTTQLLRDLSRKQQDSNKKTTSRLVYVTREDLGCLDYWSIIDRAKKLGLARCSIEEVLEFLRMVRHPEFSSPIREHTFFISDKGYNLTAQDGGKFLFEICGINDRDHAKAGFVFSVRKK